MKSILNNNTEETKAGTKLPVMESFYTIQGEGFHQGRAAYFIRLAGCNVGCHWCDVKESWDASVYPVVEVQILAEAASKYPAEVIVVTGGEPLMYNLDELCKALHASNKKTHIETSGAYPLSGHWDWICLSPKKFKEPVESVYAAAHELKIIIYNKSDFQWAESLASKVSKDCKLYLQPEWSKQKEMLPVMVEYVKNNSQWEISLQIHKFMDIP